MLFVLYAKGANTIGPNCITLFLPLPAMNETSVPLFSSSAFCGKVDPGEKKEEEKRGS